MTTKCVALFDSEQKARVHAASLQGLRTNIEIRGPQDGLKIDDLRGGGARNLVDVSNGDFWLVLSDL